MGPRETAEAGGGHSRFQVVVSQGGGGGGLGKGDQSHSFQLAARGRERRLKFTGKELADIIIIF